MLVDKALVREVLRAANSVYYNPAGLPLVSISRAVVVLGLNTVKQIVLGAPLLSPAQERDRFFLKEVSLSFLVAYIARGAAEEKGLDPEEFYLAGLFRRVGREILVLNASDLYRRLLVKEPGVQALLSGTLAERLLVYWNFPKSIIQGLEGRRLGPNPSTAVKILLLAEKVALEFVAQKPLSGWTQLFELPETFAHILEALRKDLELFPPPVAETLREILAYKADLRDTGPEGQPEIIVPKGALVLLRRILMVLCEELGVQGALAFKYQGRWKIEAQGEEIPETLTRLGLDEILKEKKPLEFVFQRYRILAISFEIGHHPAGVLLLLRQGTFSAEEYAGLKLLKKTLDGLLRHF